MNWYMLCKKLGERGSAALPRAFLRYSFPLLL